MFVVCEKPLIMIVPREDQCDRMDLHHYQPELINIVHKINELPCKTLLEELLEEDSPISSGATPKGANYKDEGIPFLRVQNIRPMELLIEDIVYIDSETHESIGRSKITQGDVLFTITGATFGYAAVFDNQEFTEANINQHIVRLRCNQEKIDPNFLALYLNSNLGYGQSRRNITGGSRPALDFGSIANFIVPCIDVSIQRLILSRYNQFIEVCNLLYEKAERISGLKNIPWILDKVFINEESSDREESDEWQWKLSTDPYSIYHTVNDQCGIVRSCAIIDRLDPRYSLPLRLRQRKAKDTKSWLMLSDICTISRQTIQSDGQKPHIAIDKMPNDPWSTFELSEPYEGNVIEFKKSDIGVSRLMPTIMNGKCFMAWTDVTGSPEFIKISTSPERQNAVFYWLKTALVKEYLLAMVRGSSASQKRFTEKDLGKCPIPRDVAKNPDRYEPACSEILNKLLEQDIESGNITLFTDNLIHKATFNILLFENEVVFNKLMDNAKEALK